MTVSNHHTEMNQSYAQTLYDMSHMGDMVATESPNIFCSTIPSHWRSNKSLPTNFRVFIFDEVKDGTVVTIRVGNDDNFSGELRNNTASVKDNIAQFNDLRFIGRSGRGKCFSLSVIVNTCPAMMTTLCKAIKITVDGPREPRNKTRQGWYTMPWMGPPLQGGMGYSLGLDPQQAALVDLYRAAQGGNLVDMYRLNQMHSLVNAGAAAHMLYTPVPTTVPSLHPHLPGTQTTSTAVLEAPSSVLQPPPPPPISALHYHQMAAALVGLSETQRATIMALEGRCHRCSACDSGMGPCLMMSKSPPSLPGVQSNASTTSTRSSNSASSSPPNTPSPLSRTSPSSTTTPKNEAPKPFNSTPPVGGNVSEPSRLHPLFRSPSFLPSGPTSLLCPSNLLPYRPPLKFAGSVPNFSSGAETSQPISSNFSAFSAPKQSPRSVDSSRALQLAAVDSTNGSSPKSSSVRTYESSDVTRNMVSKINLERNRTSPASDAESQDSGHRRSGHRESPKFRSLKAPSSLSTAHCVWRPY